MFSKVSCGEFMYVNQSLVLYAWIIWFTLLARQCDSDNSNEDDDDDVLFMEDPTRRLSLEASEDQNTTITAGRNLF